VKARREVRVDLGDAVGRGRNHLERVERDGSFLHIPQTLGPRIFLHRSPRTSERYPRTLVDGHD
jgi:hypothetical protein